LMAPHSDDDVPLREVTPGTRGVANAGIRASEVIAPRCWRPCVSMAGRYQPALAG
jgi:hypothetical protein